MKTRLLINAVSHPLFTAKLSPKNASSFATGKPQRATHALRIIWVQKRSLIGETCQKCGGTELHRRRGAMPE